MCASVPDRVCSVEGCEERYRSIGYCESHYRKFRKYGDPFGRPATYEERVWAKVDKAGPMPLWKAFDGRELGRYWLWTGSVDRFGRGTIGRMVNTVFSVTSSHRAVYRLGIGEIPAGLELDHLCRRPICCNPHHMDPCTHAVNMARVDHIARGKRRRANNTHCPQGHEYTPENTIYTVKKSDGSRTKYCRSCRELRAVDEQRLHRQRQLEREGAPICPGCGRRVRPRMDGRLRRHPLSQDIPTEGFCPGTGVSAVGLPR